VRFAKKPFAEAMSKRVRNERVLLEMKIAKYRALAQRADDGNKDAVRRVAELIAELEQKLKEIDE
jgi:hypothetical protein